MTLLDPPVPGPPPPHTHGLRLYIMDRKLKNLSVQEKKGKPEGEPHDVERSLRLET